MTVQKIDADNVPALMGVELSPLKRKGMAILHLRYAEGDEGNADPAEFSLALDLEQIEKFVGVLGNAAAILRDDK